MVRDAKLELSCFVHEFLQVDLFIGSKVSSLCSIFDDFHGEAKGMFLEYCDYFWPSFDTFVKWLDGMALLNELEVWEWPCEYPCVGHKLSIVVECLKTLFENPHGFQFYQLYFKESMLLMNCETKGKCFEIFKTSSTKFRKVLLEKDSCELTLKDFIAEYLYYSLPFKELFRNIFLLHVFTKNSCVKSFKHDFGESLFYHLPFKEFWKKMIFEEECRRSWNLGNFVYIFPHLNCVVVESKDYSSLSNPFVLIWNVHFYYHNPFKGVSKFLNFYALLVAIDKAESFSYHLAFKNFSSGTSFENSKKRVFWKHSISIFFTRMF